MASLDHSTRGGSDEQHVATTVRAVRAVRATHPARRDGRRTEEEDSTQAGPGRAGGLTVACPGYRPCAAGRAAGQQQALRAAERYLDHSGFSRLGLIDQLSSEYGDQSSVEDATYAADDVGADWNAEAAESYLEFSSFSRAGLIDQLTSEYGGQFTQAQAEYGVSQAGL